MKVRTRVANYNGVVVNNAPKYADDKRYVVVTRVDNEYWFYGAYDKYDGACEKALWEMDGRVLIIKS